MQGDSRPWKGNKVKCPRYHYNRTWLPRSLMGLPCPACLLRRSFPKRPNEPCKTRCLNIYSSSQECVITFISSTFWNAPVWESVSPNVNRRRCQIRCLLGMGRKGVAPILCAPEAHRAGRLFSRCEGRPCVRRAGPGAPEQTCFQACLGGRVQMSLAWG